MGLQSLRAGALHLGAAAGTLACVVLLLFGSSSSSAAGPPFLWQSGETGAGAGQTTFPRGVAVAPDGAPNKGHVFVSDQNNIRIDEFTPWGKFVRAWGWDVVASGPGNTGAEFEICVQANGDTCKVGLEGTGTGEFGFFGPQGIAVDSSGAVYVVDQANRRVEKFDREGHFVSMFGGKVNKTKEEAAAPEAQQNRCPVDPGDVCKAGVQGTGNGQFGAWKIGSYIAIDPTDRVYVGDKERVQRFNTAGEYQSQFSIGTETTESLAADTEGNLYLTRSSGGGSATKDGVLKYSASGTLLKTCEVSKPQGIALDPEGRLYVISGETSPVIGKYAPGFVKSNAACEEEEGFGQEEPPSPSPNASTGIAFGFCAGSPKPGDVLLTNASSTKAFVRAYGSGPVGCEAAPPVPPQVTTQYALSVNSDSALLQARITPNFFPDTIYFVEYGTGNCATGGCDSKAPITAAVLTAELTKQALPSSAVSLLGLAPGTTYHYRFVAESTGGGPEYGLRPGGEEGEGGEATFAAGLEGIFTTPSLPSSPAGGCLNEALRTSASAFLPDCRAFEMVSPVGKNGFGIETSIIGVNSLAHAELDQSAGDGAGFAYSSKQAFGDQLGSPWSPQYLAHRDPGAGWSTHGISPQLEGFSASDSARFEFDTEFKYFSEDLSQAWFFHNGEPPLAPCAPQDSPVLYRRDNTTDGFEALHCEPNQPTNPWHSIDLQGVSKDGCRAVFRSTSSLTEEAEPAGPYQLYESDCEGGLPVKSGEGGLRLVSVLPGGEGPCETTSGAGSGTGAQSEGRDMNVWHAFSEDAKRLYWTCGNKLYLRTDPDLSVGGDEEVVEATPKKSGFSLPTFFKTASPDGLRALMVAGGSLWSYDAETHALSEIAAGLPSTGGFLGANEDATRAYLVSTKALTPNPSSEGETAKEGANNLYLFEGGDFTFIGVLSAEDLSSESRKLSPTHLLPYRRASRVSPDGLHVAFISTAQLTGYDNTDQVSGEADNEVYLYDAEPGGPGELHCVSCNPTGARPIGRNVNGEAGVSRFWAAAWIPGWTTQLYQGRPLSADGSLLFFNSIDPLLPRDTNGRKDVYEWERGESVAQCQAKGTGQYVPSAGGCLSLISTGQDSSDSEFIDADTDGSDVFIRTGESLVGTDPGLLDVYDARVNGGFPEPPPPRSACEGGACQSPPGPPVLPTPASSIFEPGGSKPNQRQCPKGKRKVHRAGKTRCVALHHKKHHRRAHRKHGRTAR
jgi:DNA-binding beta-propeller fold protein YncE